MSQVEPKSPSQEDEELQEPETTKLKVNDDIQLENDTLKPTTSPLSSKEDENDNLISDENSIQVEEKNEIVSKENIRSQSRQSLLETKELYKEPAFAEICSFFNLFGALLGIKSIPFTKLEKLFVANESAEVNQELVNLQIMLMRRIRITQHIKPDKWENSLLKFCNYNSTLDDETRQMERYGYDNLSVPAKLLIFKSLCEAQFDNNIKFKENIFNTYYINEMRLVPFGVDTNGQLYWFQQDCELNIRIYAEEPDDMSGGTWSLIARSDLDLSELVESLKQPNFGKNISDEELDEEAILDKPKKKSKKTSQQSVKPKKDENIDYLARLKPEIMDKYYKFLQRRFSSTCCYQDGTNLNKKKQEKEKKKNEKHTTQNNQENEENNKESSEKVAEKEEADEIDELESELRVLPRRSARSNALSNIKTSVSPSKKKEIVNEKKTSNAKTPPPLSTSEASDSTDIDEDTENESEQTLDSSDHEFHVKGYSFGRKASRQKKTSKPKIQRQTRPKTGGIKQKKKKSEMIAFEDSSSNSEEEEVEVKKERPKASGHFACQYCDKATRQDVLLLCDMCDEAWHTHCLKPMLWYVPDGDWFCPRCQHAMLIARFSQLLIDLKENLKNRKIEDQKKKSAAERLKREMEFIGISLNNVIPSKTDAKSKKKVEESFSEESDVSDDGMRKSKKRALKKVMTHTRKEEYYGPVVTIAEGRSRRALNKVDYNFSSYDEQIKEAVESGDEPDDPYDTRPQGGLGRGKDMANIIEADRQRRGSEDVASENNVPAVTARPTTARKPAILRKKKPKLTDLNIDNATDTDSEEYKVNSEESEEPEPSEDEYLPSDLEGRRRSRRRKSDDDFIDNSSGSDYVPGGSKRRKGKQNRRQSLRKGRGKRKRHDYDSSEEDDLSDFSAASSEDDRKKRRNAKKRKVESEESDNDESKAYTASGRPLRRASKKAIEKFVDDDEDEELEEKEEIEKKNKRPVGALTRINKKKEEEDEFEPEEEEEEDDEEEELEDKLEEEDSKSDDDKSDDDKSDNDKSDDDEQSKASKAKSSFKKPIRSERNVIGMPPHRRPPGAGVARISSSSSDEEKEESTVKDVNEQESDGELPSMVYNNRSSKDLPPESSPKSKVIKNKDRSESPALEDYIKKSKTMPKPSKEMLPEKLSSSTIEVPTTLATIASIEENSETIAALKPTTAGNSNQDLTEVTTVPEVMTSIKKTVIAPAEESALPSWDSLADDSPMTELKKLADPNRESSFTPSASQSQQQSTTYPAPTYATMNAVPPAYPPFPPPHIGPNAMQRMGAPPPGYGIPPNTISPGYFPPNYYPPNNQWPTPRPNFIPQAPIPGGAQISHPGNAVNPGAPSTSDPESLGQALAGAMNTEFE